MRARAVLASIAGACLACAAAPSPGGPAASAGSADAPRALRGAPGAETRVPREYLVTVSPGAGEAAVREVYRALGVARIQGLGGDVYLVTFTEDPGLEKLEALRARDARIKAVQPNFVYKAS